MLFPGLLISSILAVLLFVHSGHSKLHADNIITCTPESRLIIPPCAPSSIGAPTCLFFTGDPCDGPVCQKQTYFSCGACNDPSVISYQIGMCSGDKVFCDSRNRPPSCNQELDPVCAFHLNCLKNNCHETVDNACLACNKPQVKFYTKSIC